MTRMKAALPVFVAASSFALALAPVAQADPIQAIYSTTGTIGTTGVNGAPVLSFEGMTNSTLMTGQPFDLGHFVLDNSSSH